jgi:UDP-N-acetylmuramyl pentapeptide phosphotransferase/UDP-N-acetylglucosamine-1-phosphate transferase
MYSPSGYHIATMNDSAALSHFWTVTAPLIVVATALLAAGLIALLRPLLLRYALARPNARSSHREPTPQGGGIAVIAATIAISALVFVLTDLSNVDARALAMVAGATLLLAAIGAIDDIRPLGVILRLALQAAAVAIVIASLPVDLRIVPPLPWWIERLLLALAGLWFVNLVNFMDGLDWMTVAEVVPVTGAIGLLGALGLLPMSGAIVALALLGATIGFAPYNRPVARLFLGDVGSLPIGLLLGWMLTLLAGSGALVAALLLPLYYLADATITLLRRLARGERIWQAHRSHFYQRATDNGWSVRGVIGAVFAVNLALAGLAISSVFIAADYARLALFACGVLLVAALLTAFARGDK